ncbi:hypothetical protein C2G38_2179713 [Gigaspora rosea]|uniref:Uncharacterized protein n=1 Tax=Gigaspora rosea TaxID=44941 RepID=A0A397VK71_9GLOM|nr:hypothetical protein C2G38_2179713 [Gigaspora rosea]
MSWPSLIMKEVPTSQYEGTVPLLYKCVTLLPNVPTSFDLDHNKLSVLHIAQSFEMSSNLLRGFVSTDPSFPIPLICQFCSCFFSWSCPWSCRFGVVVLRVVVLGVVVLGVVVFGVIVLGVVVVLEVVVLGVVVLGVIILEVVILGIIVGVEIFVSFKCFFSWSHSSSHRSWNHHNSGSQDIHRVLLFFVIFGVIIFGVVILEVIVLEVVIFGVIVFGVLCISGVFILSL